jgi:hypothetical protein
MINPTLQTSMATLKKLICMDVANMQFFNANNEGDDEEEMERVKGIEPSYAAWEAAVLPLNYTRL